MRADRFRLSRSLADLTNAATSADSEMLRGVSGLRGQFQLRDRPFKWEATATLGRYESTFKRRQLDQQHFVNAINVVRDSAGGAVCSPTPVPTIIYGPTGSAANPYPPVPDAACVPLNLFGEGAASQAAVAYVTSPTTARSVQEQQVYNINATGSFFDLWAGPVSANIGYEHRREHAEFVPDEFQALALGRSVPIQSTQGSFSTNELFGEMLVPLVDPDRNLPLLKRLDLTAKARYVRNTVNGAYFADTLGAQWRPFDTLEIRGNATRSLRAPAITELYTPASQLFISATDVCGVGSIHSGQNPAARERNCAALYQQYGITPPFVPGGTNIAGVQSGNANLENETSKAFTVGFVWEPIKSLRASVDYVDIKIDNVISQLSQSDVIQGCYDDPGFDASDPAHGNKYCSLIARDPASGRIQLLNLSYVNGEFLKFAGITANLLDSLELGKYGRLRLGATAFSPRRYKSSNTGITTVDRFGTIGFAKNQYLLNFGYDVGHLGVSWQARYTGSAAYDNVATFADQDVLRVHDYWLHNAGVQYRVSDDFELRLALTNLFDAPPPPLGFGYDVLGRRYSLTAKLSF